MVAFWSWVAIVVLSVSILVAIPFWIRHEKKKRKEFADKLEQMRQSEENFVTKIESRSRLATELSCSAPRKAHA